MGVIYQDEHLIITDDLTTDGQSYKTMSAVGGQVSFGASVNYNIVGCAVTGDNTNEEMAFFLTTDYRGETVIYNGADGIIYHDAPARRIRINYEDTSYYPPQITVTDTVAGYNDGVAVFTSNVPIFRTEAQAVTYIQTGQGIEQALNVSSVLPDINEFKYIYNLFQSGIADFDGIEWQGSQVGVYERIYLDGDAVLYWKNGGLYIKSLGGINKVELSSENEFIGFDTYNFIPYYGPFYKQWDGRTTGAGTWARGVFSTNMYYADNEEDADEYLNLPLEDKDAFASSHFSNYKDIQAGNYYDPYNATGSKEEATEFGQVYHEDGFSTSYVLSRGALMEIKSKIYDTSAGGIWEKVKKGLEMYGDNPQNAIIDLSYYPFDISQVIQTGAPQNYLFFGGYQLELDTYSVRKVIYKNGYIDLGSFTFKPTFNSWRDYSPFQKLYFYCPYCAIYELDITRYINKTINVRFYIDFDTRACMVCLTADGVLVDTFNGNIGVGQFISATDFSGYSNAMISALTKAVGTVGTLGAGGVGIGANLATMAGASAVSGGIVGGAVGASIGLAKGEYNTNKLNISNFNKTTGGTTGTLGGFLPQYPYFIFEIDDIKEPDNLQSLLGRPSNKGGTLGSFSGYLQCSAVNLNCPRATEAEKEELKALLLSGVYLP